MSKLKSDRIWYHYHSDSGQKLNFKYEKNPSNPQLFSVIQSTNLSMRSLAVFLIFSPLVLTLPQPLDTMEDDFQAAEFDYFYNLELVERLQTLGDDNKLTQEDVSKILDDVDERPEMDQILDKMLLQGKMIEEVLNDMDSAAANVLLESSVDRTDFSSSLLYEILYWLFLTCFIVMLAFSALLTTKYIIDNPRYGGSISTTKDMDFVFLPTRSRI